MKVGVLGTGVVGAALGTGLATVGHEVRMGGRESRNPKAEAWAAQVGGRASVGTFADAAAFGEIVVLATLGLAADAALRAAGSDNIRGKVVIDATNPLGLGSGTPKLVSDRGGAYLQGVAPEARLVKAFNTVGHTHMFRPDFPGGPPDMFLCGDDPEAKATVGRVVSDFGWTPIDLGGIDLATHLESMCLVWVHSAIALGSWNLAFKLLRR